MKTKLFYHTLALLLLAVVPSEAQTILWERKALGQTRSFPCAGGTFNWPNNNNWTQDQAFAIDTTCDPDQQYESEPSNWSTPNFPNGAGVAVIIGNTGGAPTNLDRGAPITVTSVTIQNVGGLTAEFGSSLTAGLFDFQGDGSLPAGGGGGPNPLFTLTSGGTLKKTGGSGTYAFTLGVVLQVPNGGTIASEAGTLQLPGFASAYAGGVSFNAASGAVIDLAPSEAVDSGAVRFTGPIIGINTGGTVRLNAGWLTTVPGSGGATFNFAGNTFQWQSGAIGSSAADPFINSGAMNITGTPFLNDQGFTNQGTLAQSGAGALNLPFGRVLTNAASGTFDIRNDNGLTGTGGGGSNPVFNNYGTLRKSAGTGTSSIDASIEFRNIQGTIRVETGTLVIPTFSQTGNGIIDLNGGTLVLTNGLTLGSGSLIGTGTINTNINNTGGTVSPGHSAGRITVGGNYTQGANGVMIVEIGGTAPGTQYDQLQVSGTAALGGTLNVSLINGYQPAGGETFQFILAGSRTGTFSTVNTIGFTGTISYTSSGITFTVVTPTPTPSPTPTASPTATPSATATIAPSATPTATPSATATIAPSATPTATPSATATIAPSATPTATPSATATIAPSVTPTATPSASPTATPPATPTATPSASPTASPSATPLVTQAINLSTRMRVQTGDNVGIGGFIIAGSAPKRVILRAIGPSLIHFSVSNVLANPVLELHGPGAFSTITNNNWRDTQEDEIAATGIPPTDDFESAIVATLNPGAYTAIVKGSGNTSGVALVELYDLNQAAASKLANLSTRAFVSTGEDIVIAGVLLSDPPQAGTDDRVVVRGIGPSLTPGSFPASAVLADPILELRDGNGALLVANNDWQDNAVQAAEITAAGLAPTNNLESAIAATLPPGLYTALLSGSNNGTGLGLVEVYDRGETPAVP